MKERILEHMQSVVREQSIELNPVSALPDLIDSITFIKLVVALESEFGIEFDDEMLIISKFPVVDDMISYIESQITLQKSISNSDVNENGR